MALVNANLTFKSGTVRNNGYNGNTVVATNGGGISIDGGAPTIIGGEIHDNKASALGGGIYVKGGALTVRGGDITNNTAGTKGGGIYFDANSTMTVGTGAMNVKDNTVNNQPNNIHLLSGKTIAIASGATFEPDYVGVYTDNRTPDIPVFTGTAAQLQTIYNGMVNGTLNIVDDSQQFGPKYTSSQTTLYFGSSPWSALQQTVRKNPDLVDSNNDGVYEIGNVKQLTAFLWYVNGITTHDATFTPAVPTAKGILTANIDMQGHYWVPIGTAYTGTFDGNGYTISNLTMVPTNISTERGLFGVNASGTIKNVTLHDCSFSSSGTSYMGSIVSQMNGGTLSSSVSQCQLVATTATCTVGGLVGHINGGTVHSSVSLCEMTGYTMGGIAGKISSGNLYNSFANPVFHYSGPNGSTNYYVGGLVAVNNTGQVENCYVRMGRTQSLGSAMFGMLAGSNSGTNTIVHCYAPDGASAQFSHSYTYLYNSATTGLSNCDLYKKVDAPYLYNRPNDNLVGSTGKVLYKLLNEWVSGKVSTISDLAYWKRSTAGGYATSAHAGNINDDYPIHKMKDFCCAASPDGIFIHYKASLNRMLTDYNDLSGGGTIWLYDSPTTAPNTDETVSVSNDDDVILYIDEDATLLQANGNVLKAFTSQTLGDYTTGRGERWHYCSSSLQQSAIGFNYAFDNVGFSWDANPCGVSFSAANDASVFPGDLTSGDIARVDLYAFYEPEYHWLNLKRNTNSHWHMNATTVPIVYNGNGTGGNGNETYLVPGKGYLMSIDKEQLLQNWGTLNNNTVTLQNVTYTEANAWAGLLGYNVLGNPYQSYLNFNAFITHSDNATLFASKDTKEITYATYDPRYGAYVQYKSGSSRGSRSGDGLIHAHQGFLIRRSGGTASANAVFTNAMRSTAGTSSFRDEQPAFPLINLTLEDGSGNADIAVLELGRERNEGVEKLRVGDCGARISLALDGEEYAILFRDEVENYQALHLEAQTEGTYTLTWETANAEFEALTLVDNITGVTIDMLANDNYTFEANPDQYSSRFKIVIGDWKDVDEFEVPEPVEGPTFAFQLGDEIVMNGEGRLEIMDVTGRIIVSRDAARHVSTNGMVPGVYIMRLTDKNGTRTQKMVIE